MPAIACPNCDKIIDVDGFFGIPKIFYCECHKIYDMEKFMSLIEVSKEEVDLSGIDLSTFESHGYADCVSKGFFIFRNRWKKEK